MNKLPFERPIIKKLNTGISNKFGLRTELEPITNIDGVPVSELIKDYGTPLFVISESTIRNTIHEAKRAFETRYPKVQFAWSYKTNYLDAVCRIFHQEGSWAEVVSRYEYDKALSNGISGEKIIFNGPDKSEDDLVTASNNGSLIHIDHFDELYTLIEISGKLKKRPKVAIRVNMDTGIFPQWDRFGFNYENGEAMEAINKIMNSKKLEFVGLHAHIGTFMLSAGAYEVEASKLAKFAFEFKKKYGSNIGYLDIGGGFASRNTLKGAYQTGKDTAPSFDDYAEAITNALINSQLDTDDMPLLILETGRALIDEAGYLLGTVIANKKLSDGRRSTIVNFGVNILFTAFWYEHRINPEKEYSGHNETTALYGPLCMNIDQIRDSIQLPPLKKDDNLVVSCVGAYNMTQWMQFITLRPRIVLIDKKGEVHVIRNKESNKDITALEYVPNHLDKI